MDTLELLLACNIRNIATDLRSTARSRFYSIIFQQSNEEVRRMRLAIWDKENPIEKYLSIALEEVEEVGFFIENLTANA